MSQFINKSFGMVAQFGAMLAGFVGIDIRTRIGILYELIISPFWQSPFYRASPSRARTAPASPHIDPLSMNSAPRGLDVLSKQRRFHQLALSWALEIKLLPIVGHLDGQDFSLFDLPGENQL